VMERNTKGDKPTAAAGLGEIRSVIEAVRVKYGAVPAIIVVDTLASATRGLEENDAADMQAVMAVLTEVARDYDTAVEIIHHTSKAGAGRGGDQTAVRGSGAIAGAARIIHTLSGISDDDAGKHGLTPHEARRWVRLDGAKANYSDVSAGMWFEREVVNLVAVDPSQPGVAFIEKTAILQHRPNGPKGTCPPVSRDAVLDLIRRGVDGNPGRLYSDAPQAKARSLRDKIAGAFDVTPVQAAAIIEELLAAGRIERAEFRDPSARGPAQGVRVVETVGEKTPDQERLDPAEVATLLREPRTS
jgi:AAA domain